jgi:hypothetical protein
MTAVGQDVEIYAGNTERLRFTLQRPDGSALDATGIHARWMVGKTAKARGDDIYIKKSSLTDPGEGGIVLDQGLDGYWTATVLILPDDTVDLAPGNFYHELELFFSTSVITSMTGKFRLISTIVRT